MKDIILSRYYIIIHISLELKYNFIDNHLHFENETWYQFRIKISNSVLVVIITSHGQDSANCQLDVSCGADRCTVVFSHSDVFEMFIVGLTGGLATGKSTVLEFFKENGIPVIDADQIARESLYRKTWIVSNVAVIQSFTHFSNSYRTWEKGVEENNR